MNQLQRVLSSLLDSGKLIGIAKGNADSKYRLPDAPRAHAQISMHKQAAQWILVSSMATRQHTLFDGRSLAVQHAYVGCSLSLSCVGPRARAIIQLSGKWG